MGNLEMSMAEAISLSIERQIAVLSKLAAEGLPVPDPPTPIAHAV
jgi:hypothetical protein